MGKFQLLSRVLPISGLVLLPLVHVLEPDALKPDNLLQTELLIHVFIIAAALTLMVYSEIQLVQLLSAVAFNVLAAIHQIPLVLVGVLLQHDHVSQTAACGFSLCLLGAVVYARARQVERQLSTDVRTVSFAGEG